MFRYEWLYFWREEEVVVWWHGFYRRDGFHRRDGLADDRLWLLRLNFRLRLRLRFRLRFRLRLYLRLDDFIRRNRLLFLRKRSIRLRLYLRFDDFIRRNRLLFLRKRFRLLFLRNRSRRLHKLLFLDPKHLRHMIGLNQMWFLILDFKQATQLLQRYLPNIFININKQIIDNLYSEFLTRKQRYVCGHKHHIELLLAYVAISVFVELSEKRERAGMFLDELF